MPILGWILFLGACAGHAALVIFHINWWYGVPLSRRFLRLFKRVHELALVGGPLVFWLILGFDLTSIFHLHNLSWKTLLAGYVVICWFLAFGLVPGVTVRRWFLGLPNSLVSNHTRTVDVAAELGFKPVGRGKRRLTARLPWNEIFQVDFTEKTFRLPRVPAAWDGLSILHLSDLHLCGTPDKIFFQRILDRCREWEPDLVALTGDVVDSEVHHRWILPVLGRLRWRLAAFAVLGNHDSWYDHALVRRRLRRLDYHVLGNRWEGIEIRGQPLVVIGHEGPWFRPGPDLTGCPREGFRLCLSHTPDNIRWARQNNIDLVLAGHNHGGQIRFPLLGSVFVPSRYGRRYDCGSFQQPPTLLHVSRGLAGLHPVRFNCRPEVSKIILRK